MSESQVKPSRLKANLGMGLLIVLGIAVIVAAQVLKRPGKMMDAKEHAVSVRTMPALSLDVIARSVGYGRVKSKDQWEAVAEVSGQVVWVSEKLRDGQVVSAGEELLRLEDSHYRLNLTQVQAQLEAANVKIKTTQDSLATAKKTLSSLQQEFQRQQQLSSKGTLAKTTLDATERQLLSSQTQVDNLQNTLSLIATEQQVLNAQQALAELDLERTVIKAPFDVRMTQVDIGIAQYANKGQKLFVADGISTAEVEAQFSVGILRPLLTGALEENTPPQGIKSLNARVRLNSATHQVEWPAKVERLAGTVDALTQSVGVVVSVDKPHASAKVGVRPALLRDTFVSVELRSPAFKQQTVIAAHAIHNGMVYLVNKQSRLVMQAVEISFAQDGYAVIKSGLKPGDVIVTSRLISASENMLLKTVDDQQTQKQVIAAATLKDTEA